MSDLTKKNGIFYLAVFLLLVCGLSAALMAFVCNRTKGPIAKAQEEKLQAGLREVLPEFDAVERLDASGKYDFPAIIFTVRKNGSVVGYAVETVTVNGYGGSINGLLGFDTDGRIREYVITRHNETPGIGSRVTDRARTRKLSDLFSGKKQDNSLPPNEILDSYHGKVACGDAPWKKAERNAAEPSGVTTGSTKVSHEEGKDDTVRFRTGATITSTAVRDLAWHASIVIQNHLAERKGAK